MATVESFGAIGNGIADDTAAIQAAFDSGGDVEFSSSATYQVNAVLDVDTSGDQTITGNNATLKAGSNFRRFMFVDKPSGVLTINDLNMDGGDDAGEVFDAESGIQLRSSFILNNVNVRDCFSQTTTVIAFYVLINDNVNWTVAELNNCSSTNMLAYDPTDTIGENNAGVSRALQAEAVTASAAPLDIIVRDCDFQRCTGIDGDVVFFRVSGFDHNVNAINLICVRCTIGGGTRRAIKAQSARLYMYDCTISNIPAGHPDLIQIDSSDQPSGGFISLQGYTAGLVTNDYQQSSFFVFDGCTFEGTNRHRSIIQTAFTQDIIVNNCNLTANGGTEVRMDMQGGKVSFTNNVCGSATRIYDHNPPINWVGQVNVSGNTGDTSGLNDFITSGTSPNYPSTPYVPFTYERPPESSSSSKISSKNHQVLFYNS